MLQIKELRKTRDFYEIKGTEIIYDVIMKRRFGGECDHGHSIMIEISEFNSKNPHGLRQEIYNNLINSNFSNEIKTNYINVEIFGLINKINSFREYFEPVLSEDISEDLIANYKSLFFVFFNINQEIHNILNDALHISPKDVAKGIQPEQSVLADERANYTTAQRFLLLKELGFMKLPDISGDETYDKNSKNTLLSIILSCNIDTAKSYLNNTKKYQPTEEKISVIKDLIYRLKQNSKRMG